MPQNRVEILPGKTVLLEEKGFPTRRSCTSLLPETSKQAVLRRGDFPGRGDHTTTRTNVAVVAVLLD